MKRQTSILGGILIACVLLLAACDTGTNLTPTPVLTASPPTPTAVPGTPDPNLPVIVYEKTGGVAGTDVLAEIYADNTARLTIQGSPGARVPLPANRVTDLLAQMDSAHFGNFADQYGVDRGVADDFFTTVTRHQGGQTKMVKIAEVGGQGITPQPLLDLAQELAHVAGLLAAPGVPTAVPASPTPATAPATVVPATSTPALATPGGGSLITYEKSGGIAGVREVLEIDSDGAARLAQNRNAPITARLSADRLAQLRAQFAATPFFNFAPEYDSHNVADDFYYTLTYTADGQTKSVRVAETGGQGLTPQSLLDLIGTLQATAVEVGGGSPPAATFTPGAAGNAEITYERSGGIAGIRETLHISPSGEVSATRNGQLLATRTLNAVQLEKLKQQFLTVPFFGLKDVYDNGTVADDRYMTVTYTTGGQSKTVKVAEIGGQGLTPPALIELIGTLQQIARAVGGDPTPEGSPVATPIPSTPGDTDGPPLIVYQMKGGIAGLDTSMTISRNGTVRFTSRGADTGSAQLAAGEVQGLIDLFNQNNFFDLQDQYVPQVVPSDSETLTVTFTDGGRTKTVSTESGATTPANLDTILIRLLALQNQIRPK